MLRKRINNLADPWRHKPTGKELKMENMIKAYCVECKDAATFSEIYFEENLAIEDFESRIGKLELGEDDIITADVCTYEIFAEDLIENSIFDCIYKCLYYKKTERELELRK